MNFWVYVLQSDYDSSYYIGQTQNVLSRLKEHNMGHCRYTKGRRPWRVIHQESFVSRSESIKKEQFLKSGVGRKILKNTLVAI